MNKRESPTGQDQGEHEKLNKSNGCEQYKGFVYKMCFGVFLDTNDCMTCEASRQ